MPGNEHQVLDFATYTGHSAELSQLLNRFTVDQVNTLELKNVEGGGEELNKIFTNWLEKNPRIVSVLPKQTSPEIRSLIARNKFLKYNKCEVTEGDLWLEATKIFATKASAGDDSHRIEFEWYRHLYEKGHIYNDSPENKWIDQMGFRFFINYFTYLNNSKTQYANSPYPYQELVLTTKNLLDRRFLTQEKLAYLADYLSEKDNFFPFSQLHFTIRGTELLASPALKTLIKNAAAHQLGEISIEFDRSESAKKDAVLKEEEDQLLKKQCADLVAFIENEKIHAIVTLSTNELDVDKKELKAVELACRENKRAHYAASQQESRTKEAKKQSGDHYHFDSKPILGYKTTPIQDLDVHVDQVQEQQQDMQHEELLNVDEQFYAENKQETEMDLDCDQDQTGSVVGVISDQKRLCEEFLKYSKFGWNIGAMLWNALFDSKRRYALSGVTTAAAEKLYQFSSIFKHGLKLNNRPDGFFIYKGAENNYILGYNEFYTSKNEKTPLTPILEPANKKPASVMAYQVPGRDFTFGEYFDQQSYPGGKPSFRTEGKKSSPSFTPPTDLGFSELCGLDGKYKIALNELLACVSEEDRTDVLDLFAVLFLDQDKLGVTRFLDFASEIRSLNSESFGLFLLAFVKPTNEGGIDLSLFTTEEGIAALEKLKQLSPEHFKIWLELAISSSKDKRSTENFVASVDRFCYFLAEFKRITGKTTLPQGFPSNRIVSGVQLDFYLGILELAKDKTEQLKTINQLPGYETAYYAMQHEGFQFVSHEMGLARQAGNTYAVSEGHLSQMVQDEEKTAYEYEIICHRYFGMHQQQLTIPHALFKNGLSQIIKKCEKDNKRAKQLLHLFTLIAPMCTQQEEAEVDSVVNVLASLQPDTVHTLDHVFGVWVSVGQKIGSVGLLQGVVNWVKDSNNHPNLENLINSGPRHVLGQGDKTQVYNRLMEQVKTYFPHFYKLLLEKEVINNKELLLIWSDFFNQGGWRDNREAIYYFSVLLAANPRIERDFSLFFLNTIFSRRLRERFLPSSIERSINLLAPLAPDAPNCSLQELSMSSRFHLVFEILCHYIECRAVPVNRQKAFVERLIEKNDDLKWFQGIEALLKTGVTPAYTRLMDPGVSIDQLQLDPHGKKKSQEGAILPEDIQKVNKVLKELFPTDEASRNYYKAQYQLVHDLHENQPITIKYNKPVDQLTDAEIKDALSALSEALKEASGLEKKNYQLQYLAIMRAVMYRTTGLMPNCTQILSCLFLLNQDKSRIMRIESNEGKSLLSAMYACLNQVAGKTVSVVSASAMLSHRDFLEFQNFYRYMGIPATYLKSTSSLDDYQQGAIHYGGASNYLLFMGRLWFERGYVPHEQMLIADEAHEMLLQNYMQQHRNVMPLGKGNGLKEHPVPMLFQLANEFIFNRNNHKKTINEFANFIYERADNRLKQYLDQNYSNLSQWELLVADTFTALGLEDRKHFLVTVEQKEGEASQNFARPLTAPDHLNKHGQYTVQRSLHARLNAMDEDKHFPVEQEMQCFSNLSASIFWSHFAMQEGNLAIGLTATPGSQEQRNELQQRYPGTEITYFPTHRESKRSNRHAKPLYAADGDQMKLIVDTIKDLNAEQPVVIVCETIDEVETVAEKIRENFEKAALQYSHSAGGKRWEDGKVVQVGKIKKQELLDRLGEPGLITVVTPKFKAGTNFISKDDKMPILEIITFIASELDHEQMLKRVARGDQAGETAWIPLKTEPTQSLEAIREEQYEKEHRIRGLNAQVAQILFNKMKLFAERVGELNKKKEETASTDHEAVGNIAREIQAIQDAWLTFLNQSELEWRLRRVRKETNVEAFSHYVDEAFKNVLAVQPEKRFAAIQHKEALLVAPPFMLRGFHHDSDVNFCTWNKNNKQIAGYKEAYDAALECLLKPIWSGVDEVNLEERLNASELSSDSFPMKTRVLSEDYLNRFFWLNEHSPNWGESRKSWSG